MLGQKVRESCSFYIYIYIVWLFLKNFLWIDQGSIQVDSHQRLKKKQYVMLPCLILSIIR